jgi:hypothetical protein
MNKTRWHSKVIHLIVVALALILSFSMVMDVPVIAGANYEEFTYARSGTVESANDVTSIEVAKPGETASGDLLIGVIITDGDTSGELAAPTDWTLISVGWSGNSVYPGLPTPSGCTLGVWYLIAGDTEPGSYQWTWTTAETVYAFIIRITGHDPDSPFDVWDFNTGTDGMLLTCPDITTTVADTLVLRIFGYDSCYAWNATYPDEHIGITVESSRPGCTAGATGHCSGGVAYVTQVSAGATGTADFQVSQGEGEWAWRTLTVAIKPAPVQYDLTMAADPEEGGTATDLTNESPYEEGTVVSIKAEAAEGYHFVEWTAPAGGFGDASAAETTFTMPAQNVTVTATFTQDQYTLTVNIVGIGSVTKNPDQLTYTYNTSVALNAVPDPCWNFASWSDDLSGTENPTTIIMDGNKTVTATFTPIDCDYLDGWVEDGNSYTACNGTEVCTYQDMVYLDYECVGGDCVPTETDWRTDLIGCESCDDEDPCTIDTCENGQCVHTPIDCDYLDGWVEDGSFYTACNGTEVCTYQDMVYLDYECISGDCVPTEIDWRTDLIGCESCDDEDPCTIDTCENGQCVHTPIDCDYLDGWVEDGNSYTACNGTEVCTYQDMVYLDYECVGGDCVPTETDWRTDLIGCESCDDEDPCTIDTCENGQCVHTPIDCDYLDGWVEDGSPYTSCNGTDVCTYQDMVYLDYECVSGDCVPTEIDWRTDLIGCESCDDEDPCTIDTCEDGQCIHMLIQYALTVNANPSVGGTVTGNGNFDCSTDAPITATPTDGWYFTEWTGDVSTIANVYAAETNITMDGDYSVTANFEEVSPPPGYPTPITQAATGVGTSSATLSMNYTAGNFSTVEVCFAYKKSTGSAWSYTAWVSKSGNGTYTKLVTGLSSNTKYDFKARLKYGDTEIEGTTLQFTTNKSSLPPSQGCFIATAAYGTPSAEQIDVLREFRDNVLLESTVGSQFVALYYQLSPPVADFISGSSFLRTLVRELLVDPIVWVVETTRDIWQN